MESPRDIKSEEPNPEKAEVLRWTLELKNADKVFEDFHKRADSILERYRDERGDKGDPDVAGVKANDNQSRRYNALWSMKQTLKPLLFSTFPNPWVSRQFDDNAPVTRDAALVLQRLLTTVANNDLFYDAISEATDDYVLVSRGSSWITYVPEFGVRESDTKTYLEHGEEPPVDEFAEVEDGKDPPRYEAKTDETGTYYQEKFEYKTSEKCILESVNLKDFLHGPSTRWRHVPWVARRVPMLRSELVKRFGKKIGEKVPLTARDVGNPRLKSPNTDDFKGQFQRGVVYEIWDRVKCEIIWICPDYPDKVLDKKDDKLKLENFFPCPKPMFGTMTNDTLVPIPDYTQWQDIALELDEVTYRISILTDALKVAGVYSEEYGEDMKKLLSGRQNTMIPVRNWSMFAEKGGLKGAVDFLPIDVVIKTIETLYKVRSQLVQELYEITGISDIVRGASDPRETASAQKLKGSFANARLSERQKMVARHVRQVLSIIAEIVCTLYSDDTIKQMSSADTFMLTEQGTFDEIRWQAALTMLRNESVRGFQIKIDTDTLADDSITADREEATQFLQGISGYLQQATLMLQQAPMMGSVLSKFLMFAVRKFKVGRGMEADIEAALKKLEKTGLGTPQDEEGQAGEAGMNQLEHDIETKRLELDRAKLDLERERLQLEREKLGLTAQKQQTDAGAKGKDLNIKEFKAVQDVRIKDKQIDTQAATAQQQTALQAQDMQAQHQLASQAQASDDEMRHQEFAASRQDAAAEDQRSQQEFAANRDDAAREHEMGQRQFAASRSDAVAERRDRAADRKVKATAAKAKPAKTKK